MTRTMGVAMMVAGMAIGVAGAKFFEPAVMAQTPWQCKSWMLKQQDQDVAAVGTWLGAARSAQVTSAGMSIAGIVRVIACKQ